MLRVLYIGNLLKEDFLKSSPIKVKQPKLRNLLLSSLRLGLDYNLTPSPIYPGILNMTI